MRRPSSVAPLPVVLILATLLALASPNTASADWPALGRPICSAAGSQVHAAITTDGADGAILAWQDHRAARVNLFAEHVLASGEPDAGWPADGRGLLVDPLVLEQETFGLASPVIVSDGAGGAIVVWEDNRSSTTDIDIFAQHVLASGAVDPAWPANGTALCAALGNQDLPVVVADGTGGAIATWRDARAGRGNTDVFAQHVLASGVVDPGWPGDFDIFAQHVIGSGLADPAWPVNGRALCTASGDQGTPRSRPTAHTAPSPRGATRESSPRATSSPST